MAHSIYCCFAFFFGGGEGRRRENKYPIHQDGFKILECGCFDLLDTGDCYITVILVKSYWVGQEGEE